MAEQRNGRRAAVGAGLLAGSLSLMLLAGAPAPAARREAKRRLPPVEQAIAARRDLWGEAALREPGGPSYRFFRELLPPLRYVDAPFRHYPIVLSAPAAPAKARLVSNGSALNALARQPNWRGETGVPVTFRVGREGEPFGEDLRRLDGPRLAGGWLPVVRLRYRQGGSVYLQEAFAGVEPEAAAHGLTYLRFAVERGPGGRVTAQVEGSEPWSALSGRLADAQGRALAVMTAAGAGIPRGTRSPRSSAPGRRRSWRSPSGPRRRPFRRRSIQRGTPPRAGSARRGGRRSWGAGCRSRRRSGW